MNDNRIKIVLDEYADDAAVCYINPRELPKLQSFAGLNGRIDMQAFQFRFFPPMKNGIGNTGSVVIYATDGHKLGELAFDAEYKNWPEFAKVVTTVKSSIISAIIEEVIKDYVAAHQVMLIIRTRVNPVLHKVMRLMHGNLEPVKRADENKDFPNLDKILDKFMHKTHTNHITITLNKYDRLLGAIKAAHELIKGMDSKDCALYTYRHNTYACLMVCAVESGTARVQQIFMDQHISSQFSGLDEPMAQDFRMSNLKPVFDALEEQNVPKETSRYIRYMYNEKEEAAIFETHGLKVMVMPIHHPVPLNYGVKHDIEP